MFQIKKFIPQTLLGRSLLIVFIPILLLQGLTIYLFFDRHWSRMTNRLAFAVAGEIAVISTSIENAEDRAQTVDSIRSLAAQQLDLLISFHPEEPLPEPRQEIGFLKGLVLETLSAALNDQVRRPFTVRMVEDEKEIEINVKLKDGVLKVLCLQRRLYSSSSYIFVLWMVGVSLLLTVVAAVFMRNQIRPIRKLAIAADRFGRGLEAENFKPEGAREVRQAARAFIEMRDRIKRQVAQRTAMLAGVSHDLRTPLTRLKLGLSMLPENEDTQALGDDIASMETMMNAYLDFARGEGQEKPIVTDLSALLSDLIERERRTGADIDAQISSSLMMTLRPLAIERALANVLSNARKYGKKTQVSTTMTPETLEIIVEDNGPGISPDHYEDVFRPFFRLDTARHIDRESSVGLGLSIALDLVQAHGGHITLGRSAQLGGLRVEIILPR